MKGFFIFIIIFFINFILLLKDKKKSKYFNVIVVPLIVLIPFILTVITNIKGILNVFTLLTLCSFSILIIGFIKLITLYNNITDKKKRILLIIISVFVICIYNIIILFIGLVLKISREDIITLTQCLLVGEYLWVMFTAHDIIYAKLLQNKSLSKQIIGNIVLSIPLAIVSLIVMRYLL